MPKKKSSLNCCICYNPLKTRISPCECSVCETCWSQIIFIKIEQSNSLIKKITCPTIGCQEEPSVKSLYKKMPRHLKLKIEQAYLNVYLSKTPDIRRCPSSDCNSAGIIDLSSSCSEDLICDACGTTWRDKAHYNKAEKVQDFIRNIIHNKNEIFSARWKRRKAKKCPKCQIWIEREEGCLHMTCTQCKHQFCWVCLQKHPNHNSHNDIKLTIYKLMFFLTVCFAMLYFFSLPSVRRLAQATVIPLAQWFWGNFGSMLIWIGSLWGALLLLSIILNSVSVIRDKIVYQTDYYPEGKRVHVFFILICLLIAYLLQILYYLMILGGIFIVFMVLVFIKDTLICPKKKAL